MITMIKFLTDYIYSIACWTNNRAVNKIIIESIIKGKTEEQIHNKVRSLFYFDEIRINFIRAFNTDIINVIREDIRKGILENNIQATALYKKLKAEEKTEERYI